MSSAGFSEFPAFGQIYRQQWSTVSRRSEPSSRTALMGEQPNPWDLLRPHDATSRHRTLLHRYRRRQLYLHPASPKARGRRVVAAIYFPLATTLPPLSEDL